MAFVTLVNICKKLLTNTISYYKTKSLYCVCRMRYDYFWLSPEMMTYCKDKYKSHIDSINELYDLETRRSNTNGLKDTQSFTESLYLLYTYLTGDLWSVPNNERIYDEYRSANQHMLIELCKRGVYTIDGCEPTNVIRSTHNFIVLINDIVSDRFVTLMKTMYHRGVNVCARQVKGNKIVKEIVYAKDCGKLIYTEDLNSAIETVLPNGFHSLGFCDQIMYNELFTECIDPDFGISGLYTNAGKDVMVILDHSRKEMDMCECHSLYYVETWSQTYDEFRVEDVFFQLWLEFNSHYGHMNELR